MTRSRTNIELDDSDLETIMRRYGLQTKSEAVAMALRHLAGQPMSADEALGMRGTKSIGAVPLDRGPRPDA